MLIPNNILSTACDEYLLFMTKKYTNFKIILEPWFQRLFGGNRVR